jgi:cell volume regulation protein A
LERHYSFYSGVFVTALAVGIFVHNVFDFTITEGLLLGAIVSATDAAAVFSILRNRGIALKGHLRPILNWKAEIMIQWRIFLTITLTGIVASGTADISHLILAFFKGFIIGGAAGYIMGKFSVWVINNIKLKAKVFTLFCRSALLCLLILLFMQSG